MIQKRLSTCTRILYMVDNVNRATYDGNIKYQYPRTP